MRAKKWRFVSTNGSQGMQWANLLHPKTGHILCLVQGDTIVTTNKRSVLPNWESQFLELADVAILATTASGAMLVTLDRLITRFRTSNLLNL